MRVNINKLFCLMANNAFTLNTKERPDSDSYEDTYHNQFMQGEENPSTQTDPADIDFLSAYFSPCFDASTLNESARIIYELSPNTFDIIIHAWLSGLPIETEITAYGHSVLSAALTGNTIKEKCFAAERAAQDRGNTETLTVLNAAGKVQQEIHRMMGLLRFTPNANGEFTAECEPDHFILPALADYFSARFGETSWSIIDKKRELCLRCSSGGTAVLTMPEKTGEAAADSSDEWEELWKHYHKVINNEDRNNPGLQKQFMPKRYWKYLPEKAL